MLEKIRKAVKEAAKAVSSVANKVSDFAADGVETLGNAASDSFSWLGDRIPGIGGVFGWLGDVVAAAADFVASVTKASGSIAGGVLSCVIKIVGSVFTLDRRGILEGFVDVLLGIFGGILVSVGKAAALVQVIFTIGRPRPLNAWEKRLIALVFHKSIATYNVRVVDGNAGLFSLNDRPFLLGNTIYMKGRTADDRPALFVHECVHVWQYQHLGSGYAAAALASQWWGAGYDWESEANGEWAEFELEAQGKCIEDAYRVGGTVSGAAGNGAFFAEDDETQRRFAFSGSNWTKLVNEGTRVIRGKMPWRLSALVGWSP